MKNPNAGENPQNPIVWDQLDELRSLLNELFALRETKENFLLNEGNFYTHLSMLSPSLPDETLKELASTTSESYRSRLDDLIQQRYSAAVKLVQEIVEYL